MASSALPPERRTKKKFFAPSLIQRKSPPMGGLDFILQIPLLFDCSLNLAPSHLGVAGLHRVFTLRHSE